MNLGDEKKQDSEEIIEEIECVEEKPEPTDKELAAGYLDRLQRTMAEFDNFRKRTAKEQAAMYANGVCDVAAALIPVLDNFERAMAAAPDSDKDNAFYTGMEMIFKQMQETLCGVGLSEIESAGKPFNPEYHFAVTHEENADFGENEVIEVLQKGYMCKDRVLRCAMVKVAN